MAGPTAPNYENVLWPGSGGLRVPTEAGSAAIEVISLATIALGAISVATAVTLTPAQSNASEIIVTASGAFAVTLNLPAAFPGSNYILFNNTANNVTLKVTGQTGVTVATGKRALLVCESTDVARVTADT
jgi:hypothetical protein